VSDRVIFSAEGRPAYSAIHAAGPDSPNPRQMGLLLTATLTCVFCAFGVAAGVVLGMVYQAPSVTAVVLAVSVGGALTRRRS
jgi:hypothetical protein